jgi:methylglutaconyl-CoA hydratase
VPYSTIRIEFSDSAARLTLARPNLRNAINQQMIGELRAAVNHLAAEPPRVLVLAGEGVLFCAGADANWMAETGRQGWEANYVDALALTDLLAALNALPCPVLARVQGGAYGGGIGLLACCDAVVCVDDAQFAFGEVRLGLAPATIAPYVIAKIGVSAARELFLSAARFGAQRALSIGLVHHVVAPSGLDQAVERRIGEYLACSPQAVTASKRLIGNVAPAAALGETTARLIAELRASPEGSEGLAAFLEKRRPSWSE